MKVRSSTRATSDGLEAHQKEFGFFAKGTKVPASTRSAVRRCHSDFEPSQIRTLEGSVSDCISCIQAESDSKDSSANE
jgi:hypothetical protein